MIEYHSPQNEAIKIAQNTTEYAYNYSTTTITDTTSFAYGEEGALIQSFAPEGLAGVSKHVQFKSKIQPTDMLFLELYNPNGKVWYSPLDTVWSQNDAATVYYGWRMLIANENTVYVVFASRYTKEISSTWAVLSIAGFRWRVRKVSTGNLSEVIAEKQTVTVTGNYSVPIGVKTVNVNASTDTITIDGLNNGEQVMVRKISAYNGSAITITPPSGATFEGRASISLYGQYSFVEIERVSETVFAVRDLKDEFDTPSYASFDGSSVGLTYFVHTTHCIRNKNKVSCNGLVYANSKGSSTGVAYIDAGTPFNVLNYISVQISYLAGFVFSGMLSAYAEPGGDSFSFISNNGGSLIQLTNQNIYNGFYVMYAFDFYI